MDITQVPPNSNEAEVGLLSAILLDNSCIEKISSIINVDDFYYGSHKIIFQSMTVQMLYLQSAQNQLWQNTLLKFPKSQPLPKH